MARGAENGSSELDKVKAELICSICLDLLCEPKKLNCDHSFCQKCLEVHSQGHNQAPPELAGVSSSAREKNVIVCACCREETSLPEVGWGD